MDKKIDNNICDQFPLHFFVRRNREWDEYIEKGNPREEDLKASNIQLKREEER